MQDCIDRGDRSNPAKLPRKAHPWLSTHDGHKMKHWTDPRDSKLNLRSWINWLVDLTIQQIVGKRLKYKILQDDKSQREGCYNWSGWELEIVQSRITNGEQLFNVALQHRHCWQLSSIPSMSERDNERGSWYNTRTHVHTNSLFLPKCRPFWITELDLINGDARSHNRPNSNA